MVSGEVGLRNQEKSRLKESRKATASGKTIADFGAQWSHFSDPKDNFHSSPEILKDTVGGLFDLESLKGQTVLEIGSGSGRVLEILRHFNPRMIVGVEPSASAEVLVSRFASDPAIRIVAADGAEPLDIRFNTAFIIGVLHHIPQPIPVLRNVRNSLVHGGTLLVWVYGREGRSRWAVAVLQAMRIVTIRLPDQVVIRISELCASMIRFYGKLALRLGSAHLPLRDYLEMIFLKCSREKQVEIVFDQLNPRYARYYSARELREELASAGFSAIEILPRHNYSLSARATR